MNQGQTEPGVGIGNIKFGLSESEAEHLLGKPDKIILEDEVVRIYNHLQTRLTYYLGEARKLGYIDSSNPSIKFKGTPVKILL